MGTFVCDEKRVLIFEIDQDIVTVDGYVVSFSFNAETFLSRIHLEDPKSVTSTSYLEQTI